MFIHDCWGQAEYEGFLRYLEAQGDPDYRAFHGKLVPGLTAFYGVRMPVLRKLGGEIAKGNWRSFLGLFPWTGPPDTAGADGGLPERSYEERVVCGVVIGRANCGVRERLDHVTDFLPLIDNWAVCDSFCGGLKALAREPETLFSYLSPLLCRREEFVLRFALVMLMEYFIDDGHIDRVLEIYGGLRHPAYYVKMAQAWGLSLCFVRYPEQTMALLEAQLLDAETSRMTLQKICDSRRVAPEAKDKIRRMRGARRKKG